MRKSKEEILNQALDKACLIIEPSEAWPVILSAMDSYNDECQKDWKEKAAARIYEAMHDGILMYGLRVKPSASDLKKIINNIEL